MDHSIVTVNIDREVGKLTEGLFTNNGVIDEVLAEAATIGKSRSELRGQHGRSKGARWNLAGDDVVGQHLGSDLTIGALVRFNGRVGRGKDGERTWSGDALGHTSGLEQSTELAKAVVSLQVTLFFANGDTVGTPDLSRALHTSQAVKDSRLEIRCLCASVEAGRWGKGRSRCHQKCRCE